MSSPPFEQRNAYKGSLPRPWIRVRFSMPAGTLWEGQFLADTGCPQDVVVGRSVLSRLQHRKAPSVNTNFGLLTGAWLEVAMPGLGLVKRVLGYGNDSIVAAARASSPDFDGLVGLPFIRLLEYGGDAKWFWVRAAGSVP